MLKDTLAPYRAVAVAVGEPPLAVNIYLQAWDTIAAKDPRLLTEIYRQYQQQGRTDICSDILVYLQGNF